jgi:hypothetical protein
MRGSNSHAVYLLRMLLGVLRNLCAMCDVRHTESEWKQ